jgi:hypothetical protein
MQAGRRSRTRSFVRIRRRGLTGLEQGTSIEESVCLSEPAATRPADLHSYDRLEVHAQTGRRTGLSDLQPKARFCTPLSGVAADAVVSRQSGTRAQKLSVAINSV